MPTSGAPCFLQPSLTDTRFYNAVRCYTWASRHFSFVCSTGLSEGQLFEEMFDGDKDGEHLSQMQGAEELRETYPYLPMTDVVLQCSTKDDMKPERRTALRFMPN